MNSDFYLARELVEQVMSRAAMTPASRAKHALQAARYRDLVSSPLVPESKGAPAAGSDCRV